MDTLVSMHIFWIRLLVCMRGRNSKWVLCWSLRDVAGRLFVLLLLFVYFSVIVYAVCNFAILSEYYVAKSLQNKIIKQTPQRYRLTREYWDLGMFMRTHFVRSRVFFRLLGDLVACEALVCPVATRSDGGKQIHVNAVDRYLDKQGATQLATKQIF